MSAYLFYKLKVVKFISITLPNNPKLFTDFDQRLIYLPLTMTSTKRLTDQHLLAFHSPPSPNDNQWGSLAYLNSDQSQERVAALKQPLYVSLQQLPSLKVQQI